MWDSIIRIELPTRVRAGLVSQYVPLALDLTEDKDFVRRLYEDGRRDAQSWARLSGQMGEGVTQEQTRADDKLSETYWMT
jgi:hypothetical protein